MAQKITRDPQKEALWRQRLTAQAASGLTIAAWCRRNGVSDSLFYFWKRTIAHRGAGRIRTKTKSPAFPKDPVLFAPVVLAPALQQVDTDRPPAGGVIEIMLAGARVVRVGADFDAPTRSRVLAVLEGRPC
jgi:transposase-like protein